MKKIFYILSAAVVLATACTREANPELKSVLSTTVAPQEGAMAKVTFSITVPETDLYATQTRAQHMMGEQPSIANGDLYVAVFGAGSSDGIGGRLQHYLKAKLVNTIVHDLTDEEDNTKTYKYVYEVLMPLSNDPLVLDFLVGACDAEGHLYTLENPLPSTVIKNGKPDDAYEADLMPLLHTINGYAGYWQRKRIDGVFPNVLADGSYETTQYVDDEGNPLSVKDQDYVADEIPELANVQLVRNFAKVTYTAAANAPFTLNGFYLVDTPKTGAVVPYSASAGYNTVYTTATDAGSVFASLYEGHVLSFELNSGIDGKSFKTPGTFEYMYERTIPTSSDPVFNESGAILDVTWKTTADVPAALRGQQRFYKVAFVDKTGYIPIVRNIQYEFQVSGITSETHPTSAAAAYQGEWLGDVSANISTAMLDDISNSKSRIVVAGEDGKSMSYTVIGSNQSVNVDFYFYPVASNQNEVVVTNGKNSTAAGAPVTISATIMKDGNYPQAIKSRSDVSVTYKTGTTNDDHGTITVYLEDSEAGVVKKGKLRILGQVRGQQALYREVSFTVMEKQDFKQGEVEASVTPLASDAMNQETTVTIVLPDALPRDIFPMQIAIEAQNNCLTSIPDNSVSPAISALPVKYGPSAFNTGTNNKNSYFFVKTITFDEYATLSGTSYQYKNAFPCKFKTRLGNNQNATKIRINDYSVKNGTQTLGQYMVQKELTLSAQ